METSESSEIEAVKLHLEAILVEQGKQICELQQQMNQDSSHSKSLEGQLVKEREMWTGKEKMFSNKVKQLEKELTDLRNIIQHEAHPEKVLLNKLSKDIAQKEELITGLKISLGRERSRSKELEQQVLHLQLQLQQNKQGVTLTERGKTKAKKKSPKENAATLGTDEKQIQTESTTSSGENVKLEVGQVETPKDDEQLEAVSVLFSQEPNSVDESQSSPYSREHLRVDYPECSCCHKILVDHVILPCCHRYCIQCMEVFILQDLKNGENLLCRICKEQHTMELQNYLKIPLEVKRTVRNLAMRNKKPCEYCVSQRRRDIFDSEYFCIQCTRCMCSQCSHDHIRHSSSSTHHLILAIRIPRCEVIEPELKLCTEHPDEPLNFYCVNCERLICMKCFTAHYDHSLRDVIAVKDKMKVILSQMNGYIVHFTQMSKSCKVLEKHHYQKICRIQETIMKNVSIMTYWLHKQAEALNEELDFVVRLRDDGVETMQNDLRDCLSELQQFSPYMEEFIDQAMLSYMAYFGEDLCDRATELTKAASEKKLILENLGICKGEHAVYPVEISFAPNKPRPNSRNLVGELKVKTVKGWAAVKLNPKSIPSIKPSVDNEEKEVAGLTTLGKELFIATRGSSSIEVYDAISFEHKHFLSVKASMSDITACANKNCLYIYSCNSKFKGILQVDIGAGLDAKELRALKYDAGRLSVTDECNIVVTGCCTNMLSECTAEGELNLELQFEPETGILHLWHALKTGSGHFVVSHGVISDAVKGVCLVDQDGKVLRSYRGNSGAQLDIPMYLTFGDRGCILVADLNNNRVLQLSAFLELNEKLFSRKKGLQWPCRIHFDFNTSRLFVANSTFLESWEVLVFDTK